MLGLLSSLVILFAVLAVPGFCENAILQTDAPRSMEAVTTSEPPEINGTLDDPCWQKASGAKDFVDQYFDKLAADQTVVYLVYDDEYIYVAFHCYDSQPDRIIARETKRDSSLWDDDHFSFWIDPFHAHQSQYRSSFKVNAVGTQSSRIAGGRASKTEWKGDWKAAASRTHDGWTGEMAIPFAILSHPSIDGPVTMGINFARRQQRTEIYSFWSNIGPQYHTEKDGHLVGTTFPKRRAQRRLAVMTYAFGGVESDDDTTFRAGLNAKYPITSEMTVVASINPDFSNVAQDVESIDFSYREQYYPDQRPFFQEGGDVIQSESWGFYSRRIPQFDLGLKTYGKIGRMTIGALDCIDFSNASEVRDEPITRNDLVIAARMDLGKSSAIPFQYVRKDDQESWNHALICKPSFRWKSLSISGVSEGSQTKGGKDGAYCSARAKWGTKHFYSSVNGFYVTPDFEIANGLVPYTDAKGGGFSIGGMSEWRSGILKSAEGGISAKLADRLDGALYERYASVYGEVQFRSDHSIDFGFEKGRYEWYRDQTMWLGVAGNSRDKRRLYYGLWIGNGKQSGADYTYLSPYVSLRFWEKLSLGLSPTFLWHEQRERQDVMTLNYDITPERGLGTRLVYQDDKFNAFITYRQAVRKGIDAFIIIGDPNAKEMQRRALVKIVLPL